MMFMQYLAGDDNPLVTSSCHLPPSSCRLHVLLVVGSFFFFPKCVCSFFQFPSTRGDDEINHDDIKFNNSTSVQLLSCRSVLAASSSDS
jgi:hypothetical protein